MSTIYRFAMLMMICSAAWTAARAQELLTLDRGQVYEMTRDGKHWIARVYVTPKSEAAVEVTVTLRGVANGARTDPHLTSLFLPPRRIPDHGAISAFDLISRDEATVPRGTYDLLLTAHGAAGATQSIALQAAIPSAVLMQPPALLVTRVLPLLGAPDGYAPPLLLAETGHKSPLTVTIVQQDHVADSSGVYNGQLQFASADLEPGRTKPIPYVVTGDFPLGAAKATLAITAPEMESPLSVPVEVRTRRSKVLLVIGIVSGLLLGFLMRNVLKQRVQFGEARQKAIELFKSLKEERDGARDAVFCGRLNQAMKDLEKAIKDSRVDKISALTDVVSSAQQALAAAVTDLQQRSQKVADELKDLTVVVKTQWRLPKQVLEQLAAAAKALEHAQELNKQGDADGALQLLTSTQETLTNSVAAYAARWKQNAQDLRGGLSSAAGLLPSDQQKGFSEEVQKTVSLSEELPDRLEGNDQASLKTILAALDNVLEHTRLLLNQARVGVLETFRAMTAALASTGLSDQAPWKTADTATLEFGEWLRSACGQLGEIRQLEDRVAKLATAWRKAFQALHADKDAMEVLAKGDWVGAATQLGKSRTETMQGGEPTRFLPPLSAFVGGAVAVGAPSAKVEAPSVPALFESFYPARRKQPPTMEIFEANSLRELFLARGLLTALSAIGLAVVGYLLFADKFVGTSGDLMTAFFWGFTTDIGLDALIAVAAKTKSAET